MGDLPTPPSDELINCLANIVVLGEGDNRRFSYSEPHAYLAKHSVPDERVKQQLFPSRDMWTSEKFEEFVKQRSTLLADAMNDYVKRAGRGNLGAVKSEVTSQLEFNDPRKNEPVGRSTISSNSPAGSCRTTQTTNDHHGQRQHQPIPNRARWSASGHATGWSPTFPPARCRPTACKPAWSRRSIFSRCPRSRTTAWAKSCKVIWEIEPGARVVEKVALPEPTGFDPPDRLDAFLDAVRWGAASRPTCGTSSPRSARGIDIEDYQLDPVVRAIQMPRVNLLIADDVGLGKTIEAGMVALELIIRHRARKILVVCPASLQVQWRDQMRDKFGLDFRIVDSTLMRELRRSRGIHVNPWTHFPRLITSIDFLKRERPLRLFRELLPGPDEPVYPRRFDLLIVDEAHNCAPSGRGKYATDSLRTQALRLLAPHFEHKLFLTATPHNGYPESFSAPARIARQPAVRPQHAARPQATRMRSWSGA